jgi:hypothetical protein
MGVRKMKIKVYGANGNTRIMTANTLRDIYLIGKCYEYWEYMI